MVVKDEHRVGKSVVLGKGVKKLGELEMGKGWKGWVALQVRSSFTVVVCFYWVGGGGRTGGGR